MNRPDILTGTEASRPLKLNTWMEISVESEFDLENPQFLRLDPKLQEKRTYEKQCLTRFPCFVLF